MGAEACSFRVNSHQVVPTAATAAKARRIRENLGDVMSEMSRRLMAR